MCGVVLWGGGERMHVKLLQPNRWVCTSASKYQQEQNPVLQADTKLIFDLRASLACGMSELVSGRVDDVFYDWV
jgi:hypothetical protein